MSSFRQLMMKNKSGGQTLNATIVGSVNITSDFIVSGGDDNNYVQFPMTNPNGQSFMFTGKFRIPDNTKGTRVLSTSWTDNYNIRFYTPSATPQRYQFLIEGSGSFAWALNYTTGDINTPQNTWWWFKLGYSSGSYFFEISSDGENYTTVFNVSGGAPNFSYPYGYIGHKAGCEFDMKELRQYVNNQLVYQGVI